MKISVKTFKQWNEKVLEKPEEMISKCFKKLSDCDKSDRWKVQLIIAVGHLMKDNMNDYEYYINLAWQNSVVENKELEYLDFLSKSGLGLTNKKLIEKAEIIFSTIFNMTVKNNITGFLLRGYYNLGIIKQINRKTAQAKILLEKAVEYSRINDEKSFLADSLITLGNINRIQGDYITALDQIYQTIDLFEKLNDQIGLAKAYNNLATVYNDKKDSENSLHFLLKALKIKEKFGTEMDIAPTLNNIGLAYLNVKKYKEALKYMLRVKDIVERHKNESRLAWTHMTIGNIYSEINDFSAAKNNFEKALNLHHKTGDNEGISSDFLNLSLVEEKLGNFKKYRELLFKGFKIIKETDDKMSLLDYYQEIIRFYDSNEDLKKALKYQKMYQNLKDEIFTLEKEKTIAELHTKFETEQTRKQAEIEHLKNVELARANATKDKFFSIIAHDLKNPFITIKSFINIMKNSINELSKEKILVLVNELEKNADNTYKLLENILDWSRIQTGTIKFDPTGIELQPVVMRILSVQKQITDLKKIEIKSNIPENLKIYADIFMFQTIIRNLLSNAVKFTHEQGKIQISAEEKRDFVTIKIKDSGIGIKKENLDLLFRIDSKFTTIGTAKEKGTGLGLIICKEFIEKNNGKISVQSEYGKGTTFTITIPSGK